MPSVSRNQQQAAGIALSAKRGETDPSKLWGAAKEMYDSMSEKELEDFASTKTKNLPDKVEEEWKVGDRIKYKSIKTGKWRVRTLKKVLGNGKYELDGGAKAYEKDPDYINLSEVKEMNEGTKIDKYDIGVGHLGNGLTIWDRNREKNGDYMKIAHIGEDGKISLYDKKLTPKAKQFIEKQAKDMKENMGEGKKSIMNEYTKIGSYKMIDSFEGDGIVILNMNKGNNLKTYQRVAYITDKGKVKFYDESIPSKVKDYIIKVWSPAFVNSEKNRKNMGEGMKLKDAMKFNINEDLFASLTDPDSGLTDEQKQAFLEAVSGFNSFNETIYREQNLRDITEDIVKIGKLAEKYIMAEQDDWFDGISVKRDMKSLQESIKMFENTAKEVAVLQQRLESVYEEVGTKLGKYFEIKDIVKETESLTLSDIVKKGK